MKKITKKEFFEKLTSNKSEFLSGGYSKVSAKKAIQRFNDFDFSTLKGEIRQGYKHSKGLKFLTDDGTYSYLGNLVNHVYYKKENVLMVIEKTKPLKFIGIYRIV